MIHTRIGRALAAAVFAAVFMGIGYGIALAATQPHMVNARGYLYSALHELNLASANKGGYRQQAINDVNSAITAVNNGIHYYNNQ
jgi:hypothetical protein